jgi:hypothetical protein
MRCRRKALVRKTPNAKAVSPEMTYPTEEMAAQLLRVRDKARVLVTLTRDLEEACETFIRLDREHWLEGEQLPYMHD